jgi:ankyrin repeat protein
MEAVRELLHPIDNDCTGSLASLDLLLRTKVDPNVHDASGDAPIHAATINGKADCVRLLLQFGANPDVLDHSKYSALHWAAYTGQLEVRVFPIPCGFGTSLLY